LLNQIAAIHGTGTPAVTSSYESIATVSVGAGGSSSISFTSIPSTYKHLQLRAIARSSRTQNSGYGVVNFNSDTAANYSYHSLPGDGTSASAGGSGSVAYPTLMYFPGSLRGASIFGAAVLDVLDYQNTSKNKTLRVLDGYDSNGAGYIELGSGAWYNTNAITSITITEFNGQNFVEYSQFALYGIKG
jgi:hypothetical protein